MADISSALRQWSATASNNNPTGATSIGTGLDDNLRQIQATVRQYLASPGSTIASASTVDLSTADGRTIPISGTSTVTGLGTEVSGLEYLLTSLGAQVWKNSSSLLLPGAADITTAAGDYFLAQSKGAGNWVVPFFTKVSGQPIVAGTAGAGITVTGASIALELKSLGTTVTASAADSLPIYSSSSTTQRAAIGNILSTASGVQTFTSSGTFVVPAGIARVFVTQSGGGGGGAGGATVGASTIGWGGAGGAGGIRVVEQQASVTPGASIAVTIGAAGAAGVASNAGGAGGTTSFGALVSTVGGAGGAALGSVGISSPGVGSSGSPGGTGGGAGGGIGGASSGGVGTAATANSGGGGGGGGGGTSAAGGAGGAGGSGYCVVRW